jgi:SNF family Na+-dependent transporter
VEEIKVNTAFAVFLIAFAVVLVAGLVVIPALHEAEAANGISDSRSKGLQG